MPAQLTMSLDEIASLRKRFGFTQATFAKALGLSGRAWTAVETGEAKLRKIHALAAEAVFLSIAKTQDDTKHLPPRLHKLIRHLNKLIAADATALPDYPDHTSATR